VPAALEAGLTFAGLVASIDPEREEVPAAIASAHSAGIRVVMITGDYLLTARAIAANIGLIDRALVAAFEAGLEPLLIITKVDLGSPQAILDNYSGMDLRHIEVNQHTGAGISEVRAALSGRTTVFLGHSGVGKSTLVNSLVPDALRTTGEVNDVTGRGKHTSTSARAIPLPND
jgi:ribosome biogenesis GTPase